MSVSKGQKLAVGMLTGLSAGSFYLGVIIKKKLKTMGLK